MLVLHFSVLQPLLAVRRSSLAAGADPVSAQLHTVRSKRRDEMGDVIRAHDAMLERMADAMRRDRAMAHERARYIGRHDALTGLPNRAALVEFLDSSRGCAEAEQHAILFLLNLVGFRELNASVGTGKGDDLLRRLGACLVTAVPAGDFVAHLGADRFAIARTRGGANDDAEYAERLLRAAKEACAVGGAGEMRTRIGIAGAPLRGLEVPALLGQAEFALSRTGAECRGEYQFYSAQLAREALERQQLTRELEGAIRAGEMFPVFQPKRVLGATGARVSSAETLLRWRNPHRGMVSPERFIATVSSASSHIGPS